MERVTEILRVSQETADYIEKLCTVEPKDENECFGEDASISCTANFSDGMAMDIKCCGVQYEEHNSNTAYTEAVLFDEHGSEVCHTDCSDDFLGEWMLEYGEKCYVVIVMADDMLSFGGFIQQHVPESDYDLFFTLSENMPKKELVYCRNAKSDNDVIKAITSEMYIGPLTADMYKRCNDPRFILSDKMFVTYDLQGQTNVYEVLGKATDRENAVIPDTYYIRKLGNLYC